MSSPLKIVEQKLEYMFRDRECLRLWLKLVSLTQMVEHELRAMLREKFDSTMPRFELLSALDRVPEGLTMGELSEWLMVSKGNVTGIAERLSEDGLIKRHPTPADRRAFCVTLLPRGKKLYKEMEQEYELLLNRIFADVPAGDCDVIAEVLLKVRGVIEGERQE